MRVARVATIPLAFTHVKNVIRHLCLMGDEVTLVASPGDFTPVIPSGTSPKIHPLSIPRGIAPLQDMLALWRLIIFLRAGRFDVVHSTTPKAGLLCALARPFTGARHVHTFTGQRWVTARDPLRGLLRFFDRLVLRLVHRSFTDSPAQVTFLVQEGLARPGQLTCLGHGSSGGVDLTRFRSGDRIEAAAELRSRLGISPDQAVVLFVGRLNPDKGVPELLTAYRALRARGVKLTLVLLGDWEEGERPDLLDPGLRWPGFVHDLEFYYRGSDLLCLPSHREGLSVSVMEAAACELPTVGTDIPGIREVVQDGETGWTVPVGDARALERALESALAEGPARIARGKAARRLIEERYDGAKVAEALRAEYLLLVGARPTNG